MSWHFSRALVAEYWRENSSGGDAFALSRLISEQGGDSSPARMTGALLLSRYGMTCEPSTEDLGADVLTWFRAGFPVRTSAQPGQTAGTTASKPGFVGSVAAFGRRARASLERCNLRLCLWKTPRNCGHADLTLCSATLPRWGIMQDGECWGLADSVQIIQENGFSSLLPTPTCHNAKEGAYPAEYTRNTPTLAAQIGGKINPEWNEWRMGWPSKWTDCTSSVTDKFRQWLDSHGEY